MQRTAAQPVPVDAKLRAVIPLAGGFVWRDNLRGETSTPFVDSAWKESARTMNAPALILGSKNDTNLDVGTVTLIPGPLEPR